MSSEYDLADFAAFRERVEKTADGEPLATLMQLPEDPEIRERYFTKMTKICNRYRLSCVKVSSGAELLVFNPLVYSYQDALAECLGHLRFVC